MRFCWLSRLYLRRWKNSRMLKITELGKFKIISFYRSSKQDKTSAMFVFQYLVHRLISSRLEDSFSLISSNPLWYCVLIFTTEKCFSLWLLDLIANVVFRQKKDLALIASGVLDVQFPSLILLPMVKNKLRKFLGNIGKRDLYQKFSLIL